MSTEQPHRWRFFRAGGMDQVRLETPADLAALRELDQKLWAALACSTRYLVTDQRMLEFIDTNGDGRIRAPELLDAVDWVLARLADPELLFRDEPLTLAAFKSDDSGRRLAMTARRLLKVLGREEGEGLTAADTDDRSRLFPPAEPNGDGLVPAAMTDDETLKAAIANIIACLGAETDRSGEPAVSEASIGAFFEQAQKIYEWHRRAGDPELRPFGDDTPAAAAAIGALREKIEDYFTRVELAAYDPRAASIMSGQESELVRLSGLNLADTGELEPLPLAGLHNGDRLPLTHGINPAFRKAVEALREHAVKPVFGDVDAIDREQWNALLASCGEYFAWQAARPESVLLEKLGVERVVWLVEHAVEPKLLALVARDREVAEEADGLVELEKLLRFQRGLVTLLRNFVSFQDFYGRRDKAIFQAGTLYIEGKSCDLVVEVDNIDAHAKVAAASDSFLVYCVCSRHGRPDGGSDIRYIVAAVTAGSESELMPGRNGLFYDRAGVDWDATVVKVVPNAISVREAFWSPYRRIANLVSEQIQKFAASRDAEMVQGAAVSVGASVSAPADAAMGPKPFDIAKFAGIFAAIGLAVGALGTSLAALVSGLLALHWWQLPLVLAGVMLAISGPSMLLAWFKLRRRNLGPILDANGWAVNTQALISIRFGAELTQLATLPRNAGRSLRDPYERAERLWPWLLGIALAVVLAAGVYYFVGLSSPGTAEAPSSVEAPPVVDAPVE